MDMREMARDPEQRRNFEKLLWLAAVRGDADLVAERLSWGIDPNCRSVKKGRTPLAANVCGSCPSAATVRALLAAGADPALTDLAGLTALDHARHKLAKLNAKPRKVRKSPSLDENNQLRLPEWEQEELDKMRAELGSDEAARDFLRMWWQERLRAARRVFNDPREVEQIVALLEAREPRA
jgi:hypothetical protein